MKTLALGFASLIIPGLGQLFHGNFLAAFIWFLLGSISGGLINILSAIHAMTLD